MFYKYDPINKILVQTKDANWYDVYKEFDKIVEKYFPNERRIEAEVKNLYRQHKGDPAWDEAYRRWMDSPAFDSKTVDSKVYSVGYKSNGVYQSIGVRADSPEEAMRKADDHFNAKGKKVELLGASIGESENTMRMKGKPIIDKKTVDYSIRDAESVFNYLDKEVQRDLVSYTKTMQNADTSKKCEELEQIVRDLMEDYMDEYLDIWNKVGQYAQDKRKQTQQLFSFLMAQCFKRYNELKREGK